MPSTRSALQRKAQSAILEHAFFRWESAVVLAGTLLLTVLLPHPFPWWPVWGWPLLGLAGLAVLVYTSLTDAATNARVLAELFRQQFDARKVQDRALRQEVETALEYQQRIETQVRTQRSGVLRERLEDTANQLSDWVSNVYKLALQLDTYRRDELVAHDRKTVPQEIEELAARRKRTANPAIQQSMDEVLASKQKYWQTLQALDARMEQAALQLEESMTALATVHSQVQLIDARDVDSGRSERLEADIREQVERLNDLIASIKGIAEEMREA